MNNRSTGQIDRGHPVSHLHGGYNLILFCGGKGGGSFYQKTGAVSGSFFYRVPKFIVHNRRIIFNNISLSFYADGGAFLSGRALGAEVPYYIALSADGLLTDAQIQSRGQLITGSTTSQIEFLESAMPQPNASNWNNRLYVQVYWGDANYIWAGSVSSLLSTVLPDDSALQIIKHDYDIRI